MINKTNKKIILGIGSIVMAAVPVISVISCGKSHEPKGEKSNPASGPQIEMEKLFKTLDGVLKGKLLKTLDTQEKKDKVSSTVISLFKHGIKSVSKDQLDDLLGLFGTSQTIKDMADSLLVKDGKIDTALFDKIFKHGIGGIINADVEKKILKLLPASISKMVTPEIMEKLLNKGWKTKEDFVNDLKDKLVTLGSSLSSFLNAKTTGPIISSVLESLYTSLDKTLSVGLLHITKEGLKQLFQWNGSINIGPKGANLMLLLPAVKPGIPVVYVDPQNPLELYILPIIGFLIGNNIEDPKIYNIVNNKNGSAKEDWGLSGKMTNIWKMLGDLSKTTKIDDLLDGIVGIINGGTDNITSSQLNQMFNLVSYISKYNVKLNEDLLPGYKTAISAIFKGNFMDPDNKKPIDYSSVTNAKTIKDTVQAARDIISSFTKNDRGNPGAFSAKEPEIPGKVATVLASDWEDHFDFMPLWDENGKLKVITKADWEKSFDAKVDTNDTDNNKFSTLDVAKNAIKAAFANTYSNKTHTTLVDLSTIDNASKIDDAITAGKNLLNATTFSDLTRAKSFVKQAFKLIWLDEHNKTPIDLSTIDKATTVADVITAGKNLITQYKSSDAGTSLLFGLHIAAGKKGSGIDFAGDSKLIEAFNVPLANWIKANPNAKDTTAYNSFDINTIPKPLSADILNAKSKISSKDFNNLKEFLLNGLGSKTLTQEELTKTIGVLVSTVSNMVDLGLPFKGKILATTVTGLLKPLMTSITDDLKKTPVSAK